MNKVASIQTMSQSQTRASHALSLPIYIYSNTSCLAACVAHTRSSSSACELLCSHQRFDLGNSILQRKRTNYCLHVSVWSFVSSKRRKAKKKKAKQNITKSAAHNADQLFRVWWAMTILIYTRANRLEESALAYLGLWAYAAPNKVLTNQQMASYGANCIRLYSKWRVGAMDVANFFSSTP